MAKKNGQERPMIPPALDVAAFREAWEEFRQNRKENKHPTTPTSERRILLKLKDRPVKVAIAMLERSIENDWRGVFDLPEPKTRGFVQTENFTVERRPSTYHCPLCKRVHHVDEECQLPSDDRVRAMLFDLEGRMKLQ